MIVGITRGGDALGDRVGDLGDRLGDLVAAALAEGIDRVLVREDALPAWIGPLAAAYPGRLVLHARMAGAAAVARRLPVGLHLSSTMALPPPDVATWSASTHSVDEARRARDAGAAWVLLSPIWRSPSKPGDTRPPLGVAVLGEVAGTVALGGVTPGRIAACRSAGASGVAGMGGLFGAPDVAAAVRAWREAWDRG